MGISLDRRVAGGLVGVVAAVLLIGAVVLTPDLIPGGVSGEVLVTQINWSATTVENASSHPPQCLVGMPTSTPGAHAATSGWIIAALDVSVAPSFGTSCYFFGASVQPSSFVYANLPGAWGPLSPGYHLTLNISTPSAAFGPGPIQITIYTSTTPGCAYCP